MCWCVCVLSVLFLLTLWMDTVRHKWPYMQHFVSYWLLMCNVTILIFYFFKRNVVYTQIIHSVGFQIQTSGNWMGLSFLFSESTLISLSWLSSFSFDRVITLLSSDLLFLLNFQAIGITADPSGKGVVFITKRTKCKWTLSSWYQCSLFFMQ